MLFTKLKLFLGVFTLVVCSNNLFADFMSVPNLPEGSLYRLAFVTNGASSAVSSVIADYNTFVTTQANQNATLLGLNTTWLAIGSTSTVEARDNTNTNPSVSAGLPIYRLDGSIIANDNADLWDGSIFNSVSLNQNGAAMTGAVWTGTGTNGAGLNPFQLGLSDTQYGILTATNTQWVSFGSDLSDGALRVYAISGVLVVPPSIPEPGSIFMVGAGTFFGVFSRRHRKTQTS